MISITKISAQSSFGLTGIWNPESSSGNLLNGLESNPSGFSNVKDWGLKISYGGEFSGSTTSNLYLVSLSKRMGRNYLSVRYTPGYQKEFVFNNGQQIVLQDSTTQSLDSHFTYRELFGMGYSYNFSSDISAGFSIRYFNQTFDQEAVLPVFSDTLYLIRNSQTQKANFWRGDIGFDYKASDKLSLSLSTVNLITLNESPSDSLISMYEIKKTKGAMLGISAVPLTDLNFNLLYETTGSFQAGLNAALPFLHNNFGLSFTVFHDKYQTPYIAGIIPAVSYFNGLFGITLSGIKYFTDRSAPQPFSDFEHEGIDNIINNRYSYDKAVLTLTFSLNTLSEQSVKFEDVQILNEIYPTLSENYLSYPFAKAKVVNLTDKPVTVKPSSKIEGINSERIDSPPVVVPPGDTAQIPFYTIIPSTYQKDKTGISYIDFYLSDASNHDEDKVQKPILINGINAWDGKVINLRYFIKKDNQFSMNYAKEVISRYKSELDTLSYALSVFYKIRILFNYFVKNMVYTSSPRAAQDYVQFPHETFKLKGGNCDDLSVCYSSLLESVGIQTALIDYKPVGGIGHVAVLVNTQLSPSQAGVITHNDSKYIVRKNDMGVEEVWIPIETTSLTGFNKAWDLGASKFNEDAINDLGLAKGNVQIVDIY